MAGPPGPPERPSDAVLDAAFRLLSTRRRGVSELKARLRRKDLPASEVDDCIRWLQEKGYLDDRDFARALTLDRLRFSPRSASLLEVELKRKGVPEDVARGAVESVFGEEDTDDSELSRSLARAWVTKRGETVQEALLKERFDPLREKAWRRLQGYLARRGFRGRALSEGMDAGIQEAREQRAEPPDP